MTQLTSVERSCLLRAARKELLQLFDDKHRLEMQGSIVAEQVLADIECLSTGIKWLWLQRDSS